jgi:N-methylhydantoinase B
MEQIADEMDATLFRAAFNPIIAEAHDASHGLYHADASHTGDTLVQGKSGLPIFVGVMSFAVKAVIDKAAEAGGLHDGDIYIFNDAHMAARICRTCASCGPISATASCSATSPRSGIGTMWAARCRATTIPPPPRRFQEAFVLPPVKLYDRKGEVQPGHHRHPDAQHPPAAIGYGDLNGQINALDLGVKRMTRCSTNTARRPCALRSTRCRTGPRR